MIDDSPSSEHVPSRRVEERNRVRRSIKQGASLSSPYVIMNTLATIVAAYGLLANSTAVVIGAMIIAMLLGPIMGLALAMVDGDVKLLKSSLVAEGFGAVLVLLIGFFVGRLHGDLPITAEILSRTKPNLLDLAIALAGGAAGAYATVSPKVSVGLVGVAISTALVPPLAASGICLSRGLLGMSAGAFLLFFTNLVAIQCATSAVLFGFGFHEVTQRDPNDKAFHRRLGIDAALFLVLAIFLYVQLGNTVKQQQFEKSVKSALAKGLAPLPGAYLAETRFVQGENGLTVVAVVRTPNSISPEQTAELERSLPWHNGDRIVLHVRSLLTKETTREGYLHEIAPEAPPIDEVDPKGETNTNPPVTLPSTESVPTPNNGDATTESPPANPDASSGDGARTNEIESGDRTRSEEGGQPQSSPWRTVF